MNEADDQNLEEFRRTHASEILPIDNDTELVEIIRSIEHNSRRAPSGLLQWWTQPPRIGFLEYGFTRLSELKRRYGFEVIVIGIPPLEPREKEQWRRVNGLLRHEAFKFGFHFVDMFEPFDKAGLRRLRNEPGDPIHPNVEGHAIIASEVQTYLVQSGLLVRH